MAELDGGMDDIIHEIMASGVDNTADLAIIRASIGGEAGEVIEKQMDLQANELKSEYPYAQVNRIAEGIRITINAEMLFELNSYDLNLSTEDSLLALASILKRYHDTNILIESHTNTFASDIYNLQLSRNRANAILKFLSFNDIDSERITAIGYSGNDKSRTSEPTSQKGLKSTNLINIAIYANEKLKSRISIKDYK